MSEPIQPEDIFTPEVRKRWKEIPELTQKKILDNVFCGRCIGPVTILLETAEMNDKALVLRGKCKQCGKSFCPRLLGGYRTSLVYKEQVGG